jgi:pimeloyl-ACP methyl ester carboxylesterase
MPAKAGANEKDLRCQPACNILADARVWDGGVAISFMNQSSIPIMNQGLVSLFLACLPCLAATGGEITGKLYRVNPDKRSFEILKETGYDPKTAISRSRIEGTWTANAKLARTDEKPSFAGIKGPVWTKFQGIDAANQKAIAQRKPFVARVATFHEGSTDGKQAITGNEITGWFSPDSGAAPRGGKIEIDGKPVAVTLRPRNSLIVRHAPLTAQDLARGFWQATLTAEEQDGVLVASRIDATPLPDPRVAYDPKLPRVLVIGDSISMNYHEAAKAALKGIANYHRNEGNAASSEHGARNAELWLGDFQEKGFHWDIIQFNHGLHDLKQAHDAKTDTWGAYSVPIDAYRANLEKQIAILRKTGAKLIWCSTTPVPDHNKGPFARRKGASAEFNAAALELIRKHPDILVTDLHAAVDASPVFDKWRGQNDVHFYQKAEQEVLGQAVASGIRKALEKPAKKLPLPGEIFTVEGRAAFLIPPGKRDAAKPTPWVWYAPTLPNLPGPEERWLCEKFLAAGIAVAGVDVGESMGNPQGRAWFTAFHKEMVSNRGMSPKPCLLCRSRGGLQLYNWAAGHPDKVAAIAGIYPVGNLTSWPGLPRASSAYGLSVEELSNQLADHNPVERLAPLAKAGVRIFHLHGDKDGTVPLEENSGLVKRRYDELGGTMTLELIPGGGHDMKNHWFRNQKLVDFVVGAITR